MKGNPTETAVAIDDNEMESPTYDNELQMFKFSRRYRNLNHSSGGFHVVNEEEEEEEGDTTAMGESHGNPNYGRLLDDEPDVVGEDSLPAIRPISITLEPWHEEKSDGSLFYALNNKLHEYTLKGKFFSRK